MSVGLFLKNGAHPPSVPLLAAFVFYEAAYIMIMISSFVARVCSAIASVDQLGAICHCDVNEKGSKRFLPMKFVNKNHEKNANVTRMKLCIIYIMDSHTTFSPSSADGYHTYIANAINGFLA